MKKAKPVYLFILSLLMYGCLAEDRDHCIDEYSTVLHFQYRDGNQKERLSEEIETIDLLLFDGQYYYYRWVPVMTKDLEPGNILRTQLPAGDYFVVAWGNNHTGRNTLSALTPLDMLTVLSLPLHGGESIDPLFYAPDLRGLTGAEAMDENRYRFTVTAGQDNEYTVSFMPAYHKVNVYLRNFPGVGNPAFPMPSVQLQGLAESYDFTLKRGALRGGLRQTVTEYTPPGSDIPLGLAAFNVPHFHNDEPITIDISGTYSAGTYTQGLTMKQALDELDIEVTDGANQTIDILLVYDGMSVTISRPEWITQDVGGGIDN